MKGEWQHSGTDSTAHEGWRFDKQALKAVRGLQLVVGSDDTEFPAQELLKWMGRGGKSELGGKERSRRQAMEELYGEWKELGLKVRLNVVDGVKHESDPIWPSVAVFLGPLLEEWWEEKEKLS